MMMIRVLLHVRILITLLALGLATALGTSSASALSPGSCPKHEIAMQHAGTVPSGGSHLAAASGNKACIDHADLCCIGGGLQHCCGFAARLLDGALADLDFIAVRWSSAAAGEMAGIGPFGDERPPKSLG